MVCGLGAGPGAAGMTVKIIHIMPSSAGGPAPCIEEPAVHQSVQMAKLTSASLCQTLLLPPGGEAQIAAPRLALGDADAGGQADRKSEQKVNRIGGRAEFLAKRSQSCAAPGLRPAARPVPTPRRRPVRPFLHSFLSSRGTRRVHGFPPKPEQVPFCHLFARDRACTMAATDPDRGAGAAGL